MFFKGEWGTVCNDNWDINDAEVACRQLGYPYAIRALYTWQVPDGTGPIWLDDVRCSGNEENLRHCSHRGWGSHNCYHHKDAGVQCSLTGKLLCQNCSSYDLLHVVYLYMQEDENDVFVRGVYKSYIFMRK